MNSPLKIGSIGFCLNKNLSGLNELSGGHYVYVNKINNDGTADVYVITSLEKEPNIFTQRKIMRVKHGFTYAIPYKDANFSKWSGINLNLIKNVNLKDINITNKDFKYIHKKIIKQFVQKK